MFEVIPNLSTGQIAHGTVRQEYNIAHPDQSAHHIYFLHFLVGWLCFGHKHPNDPIDKKKKTQIL